MPFVYKHPEYWQKIAKASKEHGDSTYSKDVFDDSEAAGLLKEEHFIPVENIGGKLVLVGAEDDSLLGYRKIHTQNGQSPEIPPAFLQILGVSL